MSQSSTSFPFSHNVHRKFIGRWILTKDESVCDTETMNLYPVVQCCSRILGRYNTSKGLRTKLFLSFRCYREQFFRFSNTMKHIVIIRQPWINHFNSHFIYRHLDLFNISWKIYNHVLNARCTVTPTGNLITSIFYLFSHDKKTEKISRR